MDEFFLRVKGIVSKSSKRKLLLKLRYTNTDRRCCLLFFDKADKDIPAGTVFSFLIDSEEPAEAVPIKATIKLITQASGILLEDIPKGERTICDICFDEASFTLVNAKLPVTDSWYDKTDKSYLLSTTANLPATKK